MVKCLLRNKELLSSRGVAVPGPKRYRKLLRDFIIAMQDAPPAPDAREILLDVILDEARADRVVLSTAHLFGVPHAILRDGIMYPRAPRRLSDLASVFAQDQIEVFMGIRNPATFLPACLEQSKQDTMAAFLKGADPRNIRWSETLRRMRQAAPEVAITVWCNEDAPLLWSQIVREMGSLEHGDHVIGGFDLLADIMTKEGMARFISYLKSKPNMSEIQLRRVVAAFMEKFAVEEALEEEVDVPEWNADLVEELTDIYDEDVLNLARIPGINLISP